jgi:hypothetical protein
VSENKVVKHNSRLDQDLCLLGSHDIRGFNSNTGIVKEEELSRRRIELKGKS